MARKNEAESYLLEGYYPSQIAQAMNVSVATVIQYLRLRVGEGGIRFSDIYFSWPAEKRAVLKNVAEDPHLHRENLKQNGLTKEECMLYLLLQGSESFNGDMYQHVSAAEVILHRLVKVVLSNEFGGSEQGWWRKGVPTNIRLVCVERRELDEDPIESAFAYTTLINLAELIEKNWKLFSELLPAVYRIDRKKFVHDIRRLNQIRNSVMNPVKRRAWQETDFEFVREFTKHTKEITCPDPHDVEP